MRAAGSCSAFCSRFPLHSWRFGWCSGNDNRLHILRGALLLTASICGMHYFAMLASDFVRVDVEISIAAPILPSQIMAIVVSLVVFGIIASSLLVAVPDRQERPNDESGAAPIGPAGKASVDASPDPGQAADPRSKWGRLTVVKENRTIFLDMDEVVYIQADAHYSSVHSADDSYFCHLSLSDLEKRLPEGTFLRVHRSFIVNASKVKGFEQTRDHGKLLFDREGKQSVPISRRRFREIHTAFEA